LAATAPNEVWCADFKGWFRTADGQRCDPLTISDAHSRFVLDCRITAPTGDGVRPVFERVFEEFGLPRAMRTDTSSPFASTGAGDEEVIDAIREEESLSFLRGATREPEEGKPKFSKDDKAAVLLRDTLGGVPTNGIPKEAAL
jgi:hypothetical protein